MLVHALGVLFLAALNAAAQNTISRDEAERANQERLNAIFGEVPGVRGLLGGENVLAPCCDDDESVVDAVFAKVERTERKTGGR
jgi:GTP cyclohydrolase III